MESITLTHGSHPSPAKGMCAMEAAAFIAGEAHSDHPVCVCPVYAAFLRRLNDAPWSSDEARTEAMMPLVRAVLNTRSSKEAERERARRLVRLALFKWAPKAGEKAIRELDRVGVDTKAMRTAYERLAACQGGGGDLSDAIDAARAVVRAAAYAVDAARDNADDAADYAADYAADATAAARAASARAAARAAAAATAAAAARAAAAAANAAYAAAAARAAAYAAYAAANAAAAVGPDNPDAFLRRVCEDFASILT